MSENPRRARQAEIINSVYPIRAVQRLGNGVYRVLRGNKIPDSYKRHSVPKRGKITHMSSKSNARLIATVQTTDVQFNSMITLTYPAVYPKSGFSVKADIRYFLTWLQRQSPTEYLWFLEFQQRGAPHCHLLVEQDILSPRVTVRSGIKWTEIIADRDVFLRECEEVGLSYGQEVSKSLSVNTHPKFWELLRSGEGAKRYVTKYAAKSMQKEVPSDYQNVGRFWACSERVSERYNSSGIEIDVSDDELRDYLARHGHAAADWDVLPKIIFGVKDTPLPPGGNNGKV